MDSIESRQNFERFRQLVLEDPALHDQLRATGDGEAFVARAVQLGGERGCAFTPETVSAVLQEQRQARLQKWI